MLADMLGYVDRSVFGILMTGLEAVGLFEGVSLSMFRAQMARAKPRTGSGFGVQNSPSRDLPRCRYNQLQTPPLEVVYAASLPSYPTCLDPVLTMCCAASHACRQLTHAISPS